MKFVILGVFVFACVTAEDRQHVRQTKSCLTSSDCAAGQCCLSSAVFRGRRETGGACVDRVTSGNKCYVNNEQYLPTHDNTMYYNSCPCQDGSHCVGSGFREVPQGEVGVCSAPALTKKAVDAPCSTVRDCGAEECCISLMQPVGRRRAAFGAGGVCKKLGGVGDSCLVRITQVTDMNLACPCADGLKCNGTGLMVMPLGETGNCV
ncbi:uncharacterized protein LOC131949423 [Physella acuta]|uniref:uncharacterized protein LOC131949423 n=1 Tax=Physella acuta TaxID=109671 RepID=UPI0027DD5C74|nr:uncharacterized protein LOC131949423 [Physella acuta]